MNPRRHHPATLVFLLALATLPVAGFFQFRVILGSAANAADQLQRTAAGAARQIRNELTFELSGLIGAALATQDVPRLIAGWQDLVADPDLVEEVTAVPRLETTQLAGALHVPTQSDSAIRITLNYEYIVSARAPGLISRHLPDEGPFHAAIYDWATNSIRYATTPVTSNQFDLAARFRPGDSSAGQPGTSTGIVPDETISLTSPQRPISPGNESVAGSLAMRWASARDLVFAGGEAPQSRERALPDSGLELFIWHEAGSIRSATRAVVVRTSLASAGVLGLLASVAIVLHALYRRSRRQAERERDFVSTVTHELRTPLAAMYSASENLAQGVVTDTMRVRQYGSLLLGESKRLRTMIDQTLRFAGLNGGPAVPGAPTDLASLRQQLLSRPAVDETRLTIDFPPELPAIDLEEELAESLFGNLLDNAFLHNPPDTRVSCSGRLEESRTGRDRIMITVSDDGDGIGRAELARVTEAFYRGKQTRERQQPGTGLGLAIAERIARSLGGSLRVWSEEGSGTRVTVIVPAVRRE